MISKGFESIFNTACKCCYCWAGLQSRR